MDSRSRITTQDNRLPESKKYYQIFVNVPAPVIIWDKHNKIEQVNRAATELGQRLHAIYPTRFGNSNRENYPWLKSELQNFIAQGVQENTIYQSLLEGEEPLHLEVKFIRLTDYQGLYCGNAALIKQICDISRKDIEQALLESEERYRSLVELSPDPIGVHCQGKWMYVNPAMIELLGAEHAEQLVGQPVINILHPDYWQVVQERIRQSQKGHVGPMLEEKIITLDGRIVDVEVLSVPFKYQGIPAVRVVGHDITERRKFEAEYLKSTKLESLGILAGGIAHDFNNILTIILGNISLARACVQSGDEIYSRLEQVETAVFEAISLTQQLLTFAKGGQPVKKPISIRQLILDTTAFALSGSKVRCQYNIAKDLWPVEVDEGQIKQVINNLVINALQAMPEGGTVWIEAENIRILRSINRLPVVQKGEYVRITVRDQGVGIPRNVLPKIFDPYFTTKKDGNGLGLATAYSIIRKHNGHLTVESREGKGTNFYIYLTRSLEQVTCDQRESEPLLKGKGRILIVDDEEKIRELVGEMLEFLGYEYEAVADGQAGVDLYRQRLELHQGFDAVIMDLTIPGGMGGKEAIQEFRQVDPGVRGIVSSGYSDDPVMADYRQFGFRGRVGKPYRIEELSRILSEVLEDCVGT